MIYRECYDRGRAVLEVAGVPEADLDARLLLEYVCGTDRNTLLVHGGREVTAEELNRYEDLTARRAERIPLQQLTGVQEFMGLTFQVNEHVLIPRQDTEILVEEVLRKLHDGMRILDMCTGSGCILISLLHYSNGCKGVGADISPEALKVAEENAARLLGAERSVKFLQSDLFEAISGKYEIIVSNPPYIVRSDIPGLMPEVREHEPLMALDGGTDGLAFYRKIAVDAVDYLNGGGMLFFEIGCEQAADVCMIMETAGFREIAVAKDFAGLDRVVYGSWFG